MLKRRILNFIVISFFGASACFCQEEEESASVDKPKSFIESSVSKSYVTVKMCLGEEVFLDAGGSEDDYFDWSTEEYEKKIAVYDPGKYVVTITKEDDENYLATKTFYVKGVVGPAINRISVEDDNTLKVHAREEGNYEYSSNGKDFQESNIFKNLKNGPYEFYARDTDSCEAVGPVFRFIKL